MVINLVILSLGFSLILSNLFIYFKDITQIWGLVITAGIFLSPIFLRSDLFITKIPILTYLNPIAGIILNTRDVIMYNSMPSWTLLAYDYVYAIIILGLGILALNKLSPKASEVL
jgi:ABC-type polysaccharide/polyol phosphate export permease